VCVRAGSNAGSKLEYGFPAMKLGSVLASRGIGRPLIVMPAAVLDARRPLLSAPPSSWFLGLIQTITEPATG